MDALSDAINNGFVRSCHDCSEGGIGVAAAEMAFAGGLGMRLDLAKVPRSKELDRDDVILFSESNSRFIVEVAKESQEKFEDAMPHVPCAMIGKLTEEDDFTVRGIEGKIVVNTKISKLKTAWQSTFKSV